MSDILHTKINGQWIPIPALKGDKGDNGVYVGNTEPTDDSVNVWINPSATSTESLVKKCLQGKKVIFLGDSITAGSNGATWVDDFLDLTGARKIANVAKAGAYLADNANLDTQVNSLSVQVDNIISGNYDIPDFIMIAIGTNSNPVNGYRITANATRIAAAYGTGATFIPLENVDMSTPEGAFRYANEKLRTKYPYSTVVWCSPIHASIGGVRTPEIINACNDALAKLTAWDSCGFIDTIRCGISPIDEKKNNSARVFLSADGIHPNALGAKKIAIYNALAMKKIMWGD